MGKNSKARRTQRVAKTFLPCVSPRSLRLCVWFCYPCLSVVKTFHDLVPAESVSSKTAFEPIQAGGELDQTEKVSITFVITGPPCRWRFNLGNRCSIAALRGARFSTAGVIPSPDAAPGDGEGAARRP